MSRWFRMYDAVLDDPKVQKLEPRLFKHWVNLLCVASRNSGTIPPADAAFALRLTDRETAKVMQSLVSGGLIDNDGLMKPHNWDERQFKHDNSTERVKRFRQREAKRDETVSRNASATVDVTAPETETEAEREKPEAKASAKKDVGHGSTRTDVGSWEPDAEDREYARGQGRDPERILADIRGWAANQPPGKRRKLDPIAFWQGWCRRAADRGECGFGRLGQDRKGPASIIASALEVIAQGEAEPGIRPHGFRPDEGA